VNDHAALASAITHLLTQKESAKKMGRLARHRATTEFSLKTMCETLLSLYNKLNLSEYHPGHPAIK
jgi:glycosyltransferase involved in cell wall biosynthesis